MIRPKQNIPTVDEYLKAHTRLRTLLRKAFDNPASVKREALEKALKACERVDWRAM